MRGRQPSCVPITRSPCERSAALVRPAPRAGRHSSPHQRVDLGAHRPRLQVVGHARAVLARQCAACARPAGGTRTWVGAASSAAAAAPPREACRLDAGCFRHGQRFFDQGRRCERRKIAVQQLRAQRQARQCVDLGCSGSAAACRHCTARRSACRRSGSPAAWKSGTRRRQHRSSCAASIAVGAAMEATLRQLGHVERHRAWQPRAAAARQPAARCPQFGRHGRSAATAPGLPCAAAASPAGSCRRWRRPSPHSMHQRRPGGLRRGTCVQAPTRPGAAHLATVVAAHGPSWRRTPGRAPEACRHAELSRRT